jgi:ABC-type polysaccharide/polyol phosphate transport system ATPase subunit
VDVVELDHVSKRYVIGQRLNARESLNAAAARVFRQQPSIARELWSLRDVSFTLHEGESLGIIGRNGAGKSTILKILAGITAPTLGVSRTRGRVAALLEVGTGFHPELTGRENIYLNGAILGMSRHDIKRRFAQIVDFSGVERFLDTPVKRFSSGMYLRLAFAVAAHLEPDVLVVDEILAVGDAEFQRKCIGRMEEAEQEGRTLIFVSHDLETLTKLCPRSLWLESGAIREAGATSTLVRNYLVSGLSTSQDTASLRSGPVAVHSVRVVPDSSHPGPVLMRGDQLRIQVDFEVVDPVPGLDLAIFVTTASGVRVLDELLSDSAAPRLSAGRFQADLVVPPLLNVGDFAVGLWFGTPHEEIMDEPVSVTFTIQGSDQDRPERVLAMNLPIVVHRLDTDS